MFEKVGAAAGRAREHLAAAVETEVDKEWKRVRMALGRLSELPSWPGRTEFPGWLVGTVLPLLQFAVLGTSITPSQASSPDIVAALPEVASTDVEMEDDDVVVTSHLPATIAGAVAATVAGVA